MRVTRQTIMQLSDELKFILRTIYHPETGDAFFFINSNAEPSTDLTYGKHNAVLFAEERLNAYPLFTTEQMMKIIEDYGGYILLKQVINKATSLNELFTVLWMNIIDILEDGESPEYWSLTVPVKERQELEVEILISN